MRMIDTTRTSTDARCIACEVQLPFADAENRVCREAPVLTDDRYCGYVVARGCSVHEAPGAHSVHLDHMCRDVIGLRSLRPPDISFFNSNAASRS